MILWIGLAVILGIALGCPVWIAFAIGGLTMAVGAYWLSREPLIINFGFGHLMIIVMHAVALLILSNFPPVTPGCWVELPRWAESVASSDLLVIISAVLTFFVSAFYGIFKPSTALPTDPAAILKLIKDREDHLDK